MAPSQRSRSISATIHPKPRPFSESEKMLAGCFFLGWFAGVGKIESEILGAVFFLMIFDVKCLKGVSVPVKRFDSKKNGVFF